MKKTQAVMAASHPTALSAEFIVDSDEDATLDDATAERRKTSAASGFNSSAKSGSTMEAACEKEYQPGPGASVGGSQLSTAYLNNPLESLQCNDLSDRSAIAKRRTSRDQAQYEDGQSSENLLRYDFTLHNSNLLFNILRGYPVARHSTPAPM